MFLNQCSIADVSISGELKDPSKSIPSGTIYAVVFTFFTYLIVLFLMASSTSRFVFIFVMKSLVHVNLFCSSLKVKCYIFTAFC